MDDDERWARVVGSNLKDYYSVSTFGRVRNDESGKLLVGSKNPSGYIVVGLRTQDGRTVVTKAHRLVALAFLPRVEGKTLVDHANGKRDDNRLTNLRWASATDNRRNQHSSKPSKGVKRPIEQLALDGETVVREWDSASAAVTSIGGLSSTIVHVLNGRKKTAYGYKWRHKPAASITAAEIWKDLTLEPNQTISVSDQGRIRGFNGRISTGAPNDGGYRRFNFNAKKYLVHQLVCRAFIGPCPPRHSVDHINRKRDDNRLLNLRYASYKAQSANRDLTHSTRRSRAVHVLDTTTKATRMYASVAAAVISIGKCRDQIMHACAHPDDEHITGLRISLTPFVGTE